MAGILIIAVIGYALAQSNEDCAMCHDDERLTTYRNGREISRYVPVEEYKADRPHEYEQLKKNGKLKDVLVEKEFSQKRMLTIKIFGFIALFTGIILVGLIIYSLLFH